MKQIIRSFNKLLIPGSMFFFLAHMHAPKMFHGSKFHATAFSSARAR